MQPNRRTASALVLGASPRVPRRSDAICTVPNEDENLLGRRNVRFGLVFITVGLALGLLMSLYAFVPLIESVPKNLDQYDDLSRRMIRLAHIAAIMLPLLNVVFGMVLDDLSLSRISKRAASDLLIVGAAGAPFALAMSGVIPALGKYHLAALPIVAFCIGTAIVSVGAGRSPLQNVRSRQ